MSGREPRVLLHGNYSSAALPAVSLIRIQDRVQEPRQGSGRQCVHRLLDSARFCFCILQEESKGNGYVWKSRGHTDRDRQEAAQEERRLVRETGGQPGAGRGLAVPGSRHSGHHRGQVRRGPPVPTAQVTRGPAQCP